MLLNIIYKVMLKESAGCMTYISANTQIFKIIIKWLLKTSSQWQKEAADVTQMLFKVLLCGNVPVNS